VLRRSQYIRDSGTRLWNRTGAIVRLSRVTDFTVEEVAVGPEGTIVRVEGALTYEGAPRLREELARVIRVPSATQVDLEGVRRLDGGAAAVLAEAWGDAMRGGAAVNFVNASGEVGSILDLYTERAARDCLRPPPTRESILHQVGRETLNKLAVLRRVFDFLGRLAQAFASAMREPRTLNWKGMAHLVERHGVDGAPIALLIAFLIGLITAFQASVQLAQFGADSLVADLVSLSLTRELAPLMTAIVVAGRSGAAIAAEMGTMQVSEEVDALSTMGFCPYRYLVFPRVVVLMTVVPILTLLADLVGIAGGMLVATTQLDVTFLSYLLSVREALDAWDVFGGALKGVVFGAIVGLTACERGLATRGGAEGVGRSTTSAVVAMMFYLVLADAGFSILFSLFGI
jgi:phospholipid/cholesterol/gamma-HCH transport system permease protein